MPSDFTFPPPPPPPPRAPSNSSFASQGSGHRQGRWQASGRGRGAGPRSRQTHGSRPRVDWDRPFQETTGSTRRANTGPPYHATHQGYRKRSHEQAFTSKPQHLPSVKAPPAVPSFGPPLPVASVSVTKTLPVPAPKGKKDRTFNRLGLTPRKEEHESSEEEDDADEEARLGAASHHLGHDSLQFEHRGQLMTLRTPGDIRAWIAERKKRYPTKAKIAEANLARKRNEEKHGLGKESAMCHGKQRSGSKKRPNQVGRSEESFIRTSGGKHQDARRKSKSNLAASTQHHKHQWAVDYRTTKTENPNSIPLSESDSESEVTSSSDESETTDSSDDPPDEQSAKVPIAALSVTSAQPQHSQPSVLLLCPRFQKTGSCRMKGCTHRHDDTHHNKLPGYGNVTTNKQNNPKISLYDRLIAQQRDQEDQEILSYIIAIGERGLLDGSSYM